MPRFRYAANSSQSRYGVLSHAAVALRREKSAIMNNTSTISPTSQKNAGPCAPSRKNSTGHRPLTANWMLQSAVASRRARPVLLRQTSPMAMPMSRYKIVHAMGNSQSGGAAGGFVSRSKPAMPARVARLDAPPTASAIAQKAI